MNTQSISLTANAARLANRKSLEKKGINLFPAEAFKISHSVKEVADLFLIQQDSDKTERDTIRLSGRIVAQRDMGKSWFANLWQEHEQVQIYAAEKNLSELEWFMIKHLDIGDFLGISGRLFRTRKGELTVDIEEIIILGKPTTIPAIGKVSEDGSIHHANSDVGELLRERRHIKFLTDRSIFNNIKAHATVCRVFRDVMEEGGYLEVQTSIISPFYGGAAATPFTTACKANGRDLFLRVSPETDLKRLLCGGFDAVFEIGRNFRNEGIDMTHQPSFSAFECYRANSDYYDMMEITENIISKCAIELHGTNRIRINDEMFDLEPPWPRFDMLQIVSRKLNLNATELTYEQMSDFWDERHLPSARPSTWGELLVAIFEEEIEDSLRGPCHVINHPKEVSPLTKLHRDDPRLTERFETYLNGVEIANAYSELNDGLEQRERLSMQDVERDEEYGVDDYFLSAVEDGMPQAGGLGIGIDRLVMLLQGAERITDVIPFPVS